MRKFLGLITLFAFFATPALAQNTPKFEVFGGYQYLHWGLDGGALNMNGFDTSATYNFNRWVGLSADISGAYNNSGYQGTTHIYTYLFGPTFYPLGHHRVTLFIHGLAGDGHIHVDVPASGGFPGFTLTDTSFVYAAGGGADATINDHIAVRLFQGDYTQSQFLQDLGFPAQKSFRFAAGIVFRLGN
ncbi:MAG TPA: outer membrane beta-barrel protein [Candidatus Acidoferrales bacterium]|nr:outer membrane beta-barrel protein [Candidatus Acidoferrales bacterium]